MKQIYLVTILLCLFAGQAFGQKVQGSLVDQGTGEGIKGVRVTLFSLSDSVKYAAFSNVAGQFTIYPDAAGVYEISTKSEAYEPVVAQIEVPEVGILLNPIRLTASYNLESVTIEAEAPPAQQKGDTTEYNASAFTTNPDASAADLIEKMPGIVTQNGTTTSNGETVTQVLVDGRPFFGTDPQAALNNLPAEVVDKIQVFDQQSEQSQFTGFDDGNTSRTINIVTKPETRNGKFGTGYAGYGYEDRYKVGGNVNSFQDDQRISIVAQTNNINQQNFAAEDLLGVASSGSRRGGRGGGGGGQGGGGSVGEFLVGEQGGITTTHAFGINYSDKIGKKIDMTGSYFFNLSDNISDQSLLQQYLTGRDTGQIYQEELISNSRNINHRANLRLEYKLNDDNSIIWVPRLTIQENDGASLTDGQTIIGDAMLNQTRVDFSSELSAVNLSSMLMFRHKFEKPMRTISVRVNTGYTNSRGENLQSSELTYFNGLQSSDTLDQSSFLDVDGTSGTFNVQYTEPLFGRTMLNSWYSFSPRWDDSQQETFNYDPVSDAYSTLESTLSSVFNSSYRTQELGTGIMSRMEKGMLMARVGFQEAKLNNEQTYPTTDTVGYTFYNVLPMLMFRSGRGRQNSFMAMYRSNTNSPSISQLQDVIDNSNPLQLRTGNPELEQSTQHRMVVRYNKTNTEAGRLISLNLSAELTQGYITNSSFVAREDVLLNNGVVLQRGSQLTRPVNLDGYRNVRGFVTYGQLVEAIKTNLNLSLSSTYTRTPGLVNDIENISDNVAFGAGVVLSSNISPNIDFTLSSNTDFNNATNTAQPGLDTRYWSQRSRARINLIAPGGWVLRSTATHQLYRGLTDDFNQDYVLWSGGVAKKFFHNDRGELELSVFDILGQNTSINRTATEIYIQDQQQVVLQRYLMLSFRYQLRNFEPQVPDGPPGGEFGPRGGRDGFEGPPGGRP